MNSHDQFAEDALLYALGSLEGADRQRFEAHLRDCAECRRELQAIQEDLGLLALSTAGPKPPARSRQRLLTSIAKEPRHAATRQPQGVSARWVLIPWVAMFVFVVLSTVLYFANLKLKTDLGAIRASSAQQDVDLRQAREMLELLKSPDAVRVTLMPGKEKPSPQGKTIYSPKAGRLIFMASNMPPAPPNKAYELWLVPKHGAPMACGTFWPDASGNATMMHTELPTGMEPKAFAVTLENAEGSSTPTMPMVLAGNVSP